MTRTCSLLVAAVLAAAACKKAPDSGAAGAGSGSAAQPAEPAAPAAGSGSAAAPAGGSDGAAAAAAAPPAPSGPYELPADARVIKEREGKKGDATALGAQLTLHLVNRIGTDDPGDPARHVDQLLAIAGTGGTGSVVVELGYVSDADPAYHDHMIQPLAPLTPARAFSPDDAKIKLAFTGPLLYLKHWKGGDIAVAQDGDAIAVWRSDTTQGEGEEGKAGAWYPQAKIAIAPGAKVTAQ